MECKNDRATECRCVGAGCPGPDSRTWDCTNPATIYGLNSSPARPLTSRVRAIDLMGGAWHTHQSAFVAAPHHALKPNASNSVWSQVASRGLKRYWSHPSNWSRLSWAQRDQDSCAGRTRSRLLDARCGLGTETGADRLGQSRLIHLLFYAGDNLSFNLDLAFLFHETALL